jgi:hypothetical protein
MFQLSNAHTSNKAQMKSGLEDNTSLSNVEVLELLPLKKLSFKYIPNLPLYPPPKPIEFSFAHYN